MPLRILVADDHAVVRDGLRVGLSEFDILVAGESADGDGLLALVGQQQFEVALIDIRMPVRDGLSVLEALHTTHPECRVVMMTGYNNPHFIAASIKFGAKGFITKDALLADFAKMLHAVAKGEDTFTRDNGRRITGALATQRLGVEHDVSLTRRECEVLGHLGKGLTNKQIAEFMSISYETVKEHVQHILQKVGVVDRTQAVYWGLRTGLIAMDRLSG